MEHSKIILAEFHGETMDVPVTLPNNKILFNAGFRIFKLYDHCSKVITEYDPKTDSIDLSKCIFRIGHTLVSVGLEVTSNTMKWIKWTIMDASVQGFVLDNQQWCNELETEELDKLYPTYRSQCFHDPKRYKLY